MTTLPAASSAGARGVTANGTRRLAPPFTARLWRDLAAAVGVRRLARRVGYSESTIYKQGEIPSDLLPDEQPQTVRTNPVQAVADALVLAIETGNEDEAIEIVRCLAMLVDQRVVPVVDEPSCNPVDDCLIAGHSLAQATHKLFSALDPASPGGVAVTPEEAEAAEPELLEVQTRVRKAIELCALARVRSLRAVAGGKR